MTSLRAGLSCLALVCILASGAGCSSVDVEVDYDHTYDFAPLRTFAWKPQADTVAEAPQSLGDRRLRRAVNTHLIQLGYRRDDKSPDFLLSYTAFLENKTEVRSWGYHPYPYGYVGWYDYGGRHGGHVEVDVFTEGTLILDIVDTRRSVVVWRGTATAVVGRAGAGEEKINEAVDQLLSDFPPDSEPPVMSLAGES